MYPGGRKKQCSTVGCENKIPVDLDFCILCQQRLEEERLRQEHIIKEISDREIEALEHLLERHARFEELYGPE